MAAAFIHSKLTPLVIVASIALGVLAVLGAAARRGAADHRADGRRVRRRCPARRPAEVEQRVTRPIEKLLWEVPGVEYVYSTSSPGQVDGRSSASRSARTRSRRLVRLNQKLARQPRPHPARRHRAARQAALDRRRADPGRHAVVDALRRRPAAHARRAAARRRSRKCPTSPRSTLIGGRPRVGPRRARSGAPRRRTASIRCWCSGRCRGANVRAPAAGPAAGRRRSRRRSRPACACERSSDVRRRRGRVRERAAGARRATWRRSWTATPSPRPTCVVPRRAAAAAAPAVTLAVAKRKGTNAIDVAHRVQAEGRGARRARSCPRRARHDHAQLRRDGRREDQRAALPHVHRRACRSRC